MPLQFRRGNEAEFTSGKLLTGEPAYCTDSNHFFIGDAESGAIRIADQAYVDTKVAAVANGSPKGSYASLTDLQTAYPNGASGIYVVRSNNHWYFWSGSAWSDGGPYLYNGDYTYEIPLVAAICNSGKFTVGLSPTPDSVFFGLLMRVNYTNAITWAADGTGASFNISGVSSTYPLVANVGNAYYNKTLPAGVHLTVFSDGKWIIIDAAQQLGCDFSNPIFVKGHKVITDAEIHGDATLQLKALYLSGDQPGNKAVTQNDIDAALTPVKGVNGVLKGDGAGAFRLATAADMAIADAGGYYNAADVEGALQEAGKAIYFPAINLISNGDFSKGTTGWSAYNGSGSVASKIYTHTADGTAAAGKILTLNNLSPLPIVGYKYYLKSRQRVTNSNAKELSLQLYSYTNQIAKSISKPIANNWYNLSGVVTVPSNVGSLAKIGCYHIYDTEAASNGMVMDVQYVLAIDLTTTFGAGNEPTAAQMDAMLSRFTNSWFDGTTNLFNAGYVYNRVTSLDNVKANVKQEDWITPTLLNGWVNISGHELHYFKDNFGSVKIIGQVYGGSDNTIIIFPSGYRPKQDVLFICESYDGSIHSPACGVITPNGLLFSYKVSVPSNGWIGINISFRADQ